MDCMENDQEIGLRRRLSWYERAAWFSLLCPSIIVMLAATKILANLSVPMLKGVGESEFLVLFFSSLCGVRSILGFSQYKRHGTLWVALVGTTASVAVGYLVIEDLKFISSPYY